MSAVCYGKMMESGVSKVDNLFISQLTNICKQSHTKVYKSGVSIWVPYLHRL